MALPNPLGGNPYPYLVAPVSRKTHGPKLYWLDGATKRYITLDVIPSLDETQSSTLTQFPVQDGTTYSDHVVHFPTQLKVEIVQTNEPFEDVDANGERVEFPVEDMGLNLPHTNFRPRGLLALSLFAEQGLATLGNAALGAFGIGGELGAGGFKVPVAKNPNFRDRINELMTALESCRLGARLLTLDWLGRVWSNLAIETLSYKRATGSSKGSFSLTLTQVTTTTTDTASLPDPSELRLKPEANGGQQQAKAPSSAEVKVVEDYESVGFTGLKSAGVIKP